MKQLINIIFLPFMLVVGCSTMSPSHPKPIPHPPDYHYTAVNKCIGGQNRVSCSMKKSVAQSHALKNKSYRTRGQCQGACRIKSCVRTTRLSSSKYWYTCYVKNRSQGGLWSGTSHSRFTSTSRAFDRCRRLSSMPTACYFKYCCEW